MDNVAHYFERPPWPRFGFSDTFAVISLLYFLNVPVSFLWCLHSYISEIDENPHPGGFENFVLPQMPKKSPKLLNLTV